MKLRHAIATLATTLMSTSPALAQSPAPLPGFELERMEFNPSAAGSLLVGTGAMPEAGQLRVSLLAHHEQNPLTFNGSDVGRSVVVRSRLTTHVLAAWSVTDRLELGLQLPFIVQQKSGDVNPLGIASPSTSGLATPQLHVRLGLLAERSGDPMDVALELGTGLPVGSQEALARDDGFRFTPKVMAGHTFGWLRAGAEAGLLLQRPITLSRETAKVRDELGNEIRFGTSLSTVNDGLRGELAVRGAIPLVRSPASLEVLAGARYPLTRGWEVFALGGAGLGSHPGTPLFRAVAGISFGGSVAHRATVADCSQTGTCQASSSGLDAPVALALPDPPEVAPAPDNDPDHDHVPNEVDNCPHVPGPVENQGCPGERQLVVITQRQIRIMDKIYFEFSKAKIQSRSFALLDQVAHVLQEHPEITLISIDGHTDNVGGARYNDALSLARAEAVRHYLVEQGVSASRMATRGFGFSRPAVSNDTPEGRDFNRRVEFNIVSLEPGGDEATHAAVSHR